MPQRESLCQWLHEQNYSVALHEALQGPCFLLLSYTALSQIHPKTPDVGRLSSMKCMAIYIFATESTLLRLLACLIVRLLVLYFSSSCK